MTTFVATPRPGPVPCGGLLFPRRDLFLGVQSVFQEDKCGRRQKDWSRGGLAWAQAITRHTSSPKLCQFQFMIYLFSGRAIPLTLIPRATGSSEVSIPRALGFDDNKVDGVGGSNGESSHCQVRPDHPRWRSLER